MPRGIFVRSILPIYCGVYAILNIESGETYIGSSQNIRRRFKRHINQMKHGSQENPGLRQAALEFDISEFTLCILEETEDNKETRLDRETFWLRYYRPEYNVSFDSRCIPGNKHGFGRIVAESERIRSSEFMKGRTFALGHKQTQEDREKKSIAAKASWARRKSSLNWKVEL